MHYRTAGGIGVGEGSHVDFETNESLPLIQGLFLGHGLHGPVHSTTTPSGQIVAWKRKYRRSRVSQKEQEEINILKKLRHPHIIELISTYTHGQYQGLLLYPVAVTDLWTFFEDLGFFTHPQLEYTEEYYKALPRFLSLKLDLETQSQREETSYKKRSVAS